MSNLGLLVLRLGLGLTVAAHGSQKVFGWYGGSGITGFAASLRKMRLKPPTFWSWMAALSEFVGGLLVAFGLLSPIGSFMVMGAMTMAIWLVHWTKGFWNKDGGLEFPFTIWVGAFALTLTGPGAVSLDGFLGIRLPEPLTWIAGAVLLVLGVGAALQSRKLPAPESERAPAA